MEALWREIDPILDHLAALDLKDADAARQSLEARFPRTDTLERLCRENLGAICPKEAGAARFGRLARERRGFSVDVVLSRGKGRPHLHPGGEVNLCFAFEGRPTFDGHGPGWVVFPPGSRHPADVSGGAMLMIYFLPGGRIEWQ